MKGEVFLSDYLRNIFTNDNLLIGISELSKMTNVSPRQLRYWESKGYIRSVDEKQGQTARKYRLFTVFKVQLIKKYLDNDCTLNQAIQKADTKIQMAKSFRQLFKQGKIEIQVIQERFIVVLFKKTDLVNETLYVVFDEHEDNFFYFTDNLKNEQEIAHSIKERLNKFKNNI